MTTDKDDAPDPKTRLSRFVARRPEVLAWAAVGSWALESVVAAAEWSLGWRGWGASVLSFPVFVVTTIAVLALAERDPERAGPDALRGALAGALLGVATAIVLASRSGSDAGGPIGRMLIFALGLSAIGSVCGALAGPIIGVVLRAVARASRRLIHAWGRR